MRRAFRMARSTLLVALAMACAPESDGDGVLDPAFNSAAAQPADRCMNVAFDGVAPLGPVAIPAMFGGGFALGALPTPVTLGSMTGDLLSWITGQRPTGARGQGALHLTLHHAFLANDGVSWFLTDDRAVCAPGNSPTSCRVNDVLTVADGAGVFANAGGSLRNHGVIDFAGSSLTVALRGRICGDGI